MAPMQLDLKNIFFLSSVKILATVSSKICLINACLPLLVIRDPAESNDVFQKRIYCLQALIYDDSSTSLYHAMGSVDSIPVNMDALLDNLFYRAGEAVAESQPFMACFQRQMSENEIAWDELLRRTHNKGEWSRFNTISFICKVSIPEGVNLSDVSTVNPSRDNLLSILQCRLQISLSMIRSRRIMDASRLQLEDCFSFTSTVDNLDMCTACGKKTSYLMQQCFPKLPPILVIVLKRFSYTPSTGVHRFCHSSSKITTMIEFPLEGLDLHSVVCGESNCVYDLCCVCNHSGTAEFGHYYAYCREGDRWYEYNDEMVHEIPKEVIRSANAYLLFYRRRESSDTNGIGNKNDRQEGNCPMNIGMDVSKPTKPEKVCENQLSPELMDDSEEECVVMSTNELNTTSTMKNLEMDQQVQHKPWRRYFLFFISSCILLLLLLVVLYF